MTEQPKRFRVERDKPGRWVIRNTSSGVYRWGTWPTGDSARAEAFRLAYAQQKVGFSL